MAYASSWWPSCTHPHYKPCNTIMNTEWTCTGLYCVCRVEYPHQCSDVRINSFLHGGFCSSPVGSVSDIADFIAEEESYATGVCWKVNWSIQLCLHPHWMCITMYCDSTFCSIRCLQLFNSSHRWKLCFLRSQNFVCMTIPPAYLSTYPQLLGRWEGG